MRKFFTAVIIIPLAVLFVAFAVANRHEVTVSLDPFSSGDPELSWPVPLFVLILAAAILGVIAGGIATWIGQRRWRRAARRHLAEAEAARAELATLRASAQPPRDPRGQLVPAAPAGLFGPYGRDKQGAAL